MAVNVQAAVEAQILGMNLMGMASKTTEGGMDRLEFLVMPSAAYESVEFTVEQVVDEINKTVYKIKNNTDSTNNMKDGDKVVKPGDITKALSVVGLNNAVYTFMQTFVHYKKVTESGQDNGETTFEYAIGVHIKGKQNAGSNEFKFLQLKEVYINVWDTNNQKVLERMQIWTPEQLQMK